MLKILIFILGIIFCITHTVADAHAIVDPLSVPNNKFGVHILFTTELSEAARLINSGGGNWGYVTIPIQAGDKDLEKWQKFMDEARERHIMPIIRLASENYYFDTKVWRKPQYDDILDFANFLNSLDWPVKNRYIVVFNEVNRGDEWGGSPNPKEYANILSYAVSVFKSANIDFFIISAGLDNASANVPDNSLNQYNFMIQMNGSVPGIFSQIDGLGSHSYPNPAFSQPPWIITDKSISSFKYEKNLADELSGKNLPVFITETGWSNKKLSKNQIGSYFIYAFKSVWTDNNVVAVTPFLLNAGAGPFAQFSLIDKNGEKNEIYNAIFDIPKTLGDPKLSKAKTMNQEHVNNEGLPTKDFTNYKKFNNSAVKNKVSAAVELIRWILRL